MRRANRYASRASKGASCSPVPYAKLERGAFGIPAPRGGEDTVCDVALTPLLAADRTGVRLGYGGGYYDAYFAKRPQTLRVGLAYEAQLTQSLPREAWDLPLQAVVTERERIAFRCLTALPRTRYNIDNIRTAARTAGKRPQNAAPFRKALFYTALCIYGDVTDCADGETDDVS